MDGPYEKKILFLCEYPFTQHNSFKMEVDYLKKKKLDFTVIDLSQIIYGKIFLENGNKNGKEFN